MSIDDYMTVNEAIYRWSASPESVKQRLKPSRNKSLDQLIDSGLVKYFKQPGRTRGEWILTKDFMEEYYGKEK